MTAPPIEPLLTTQQCADLFGVSQETIRSWLKDGRLNGIKPTGTWRVRESEIKRFIDENHGGAR